MTRVSRALPTVLVSLLLLLTLGAPALVSVSAPAAAQVPDKPVRTAGGPTQFLTLAIDSVTPSAVTASSMPTVTVTGTVRNTGDRPVSDIAVRLQRAEPLSTPDAMRTALTVDSNTYDTVGRFVDIAPTLATGAATSFSLSLPLRSTAGPSLDITAPGVYPMLVNVNGQPDFGQQARLDEARFLLPVLGVPRDGAAADPGDPAAQPVVASTAAPVATTLFWPLAERPVLVGGEPGSIDDKVRLVDDDLAGSLASGGRLDGMVTALENALAPAADPDGRLAAGVCLAVDPDLLVTAANMARGYLVLDRADDPTGPTHDGTGSAAAAAWLDRVRALASKTCVTGLPFAQTDLAAVASIGDALLTSSALDSPADVVDALLGVTSRRDLVLPNEGVVNERTADLLRGRPTPTTVVVAANAVTDNPSVTLVGIPGRTDAAANPLRAALVDPYVASAVAGVGEDPQTPSFTPRDLVYDLGRDSRTARLQDALGALTWSAVTPTPDTQRSLIVTPPQTWTVDATEAAATLALVSTLLRTGLAVPQPVSTLLDRIPGTLPAPSVAPNYPAAATADGPSAAIFSDANVQARRIDSLMSALVDDPNSPLTSRRFTNPLREDLLRAMTTAGRRGGGLEAADTAATDRMGDTRRGIDDAIASVSVVAPGGVFTLASEQSPLLLVARNDLPIGITVRLAVDAPAAMEVSDIGPTLLPARGSRSLQVPATVKDSAKMVVTFALTTADGTSLGQPTSVNVRSNAYGRVLALITAGAAALLLVLAGRRLWHRFRGQPDPADET